MKVNQELLRRFHEGKCSDEEIEVVLKWLDDHADSEEISFPEHEVKPILKERMWGNITKGTELEEGKVVPLRRKIIRLSSIAASAVMISGLSVMLLCQNGVLNTEDTFRNTELAKKEMQLGKWDLALNSNSELNIISNFCRTETTLNFSGNFEIINTSSKDLEVELSALNVKSPFSQKKIKLLKNRKYYIFSHLYKSEEVYALRESELYKLPISLQNKVEKLFNI